MNKGLRSGLIILVVLGASAIFLQRQGLIHIPGMAAIAPAPHSPRSAAAVTPNIVPATSSPVSSGAASETNPVLANEDQGSFSQTGSLNDSRASHTATLLPDGRVLIVGGWGTEQCKGENSVCQEMRTTAELYDPKTGKFTKIGQSITARTGHTATLLPNGTVLIAGGLQDQDPFEGSTKKETNAVIYDPATGKFKATGDLNIARFDHTATVLPDGKVLIAGGGAASAELYDPRGGKFTLLTSKMAEARTDNTATLLPDGKVLLAGGIRNGTNKDYLSSAELFDPESGKFIPTGNLTSERADHKATLLKNGKVLIIGGRNKGGYLDSTELYDPATGAFSKAADLPPTRGGYTDTARAGYTVTLLPNGKVLICGGIDNSGGLSNNFKLYDPAANLFNTFIIPSEFSVPENHTATLLHDGNVLIVGGVNPYDDGIAARNYTLPDALLYHPGAGGGKSLRPAESPRRYCYPSQQP